MPVKNTVSAVALLVLLAADVAFAGCSWSSAYGCVNEDKYECPGIQGYLTCEGQEAGCAGASNMYATEERGNPTHSPNRHPQAGALRPVNIDPHSGPSLA